MILDIKYFERLFNIHKYSKSKMSTNPETIWKRNSKNKEIPEEHRSRLDRENEQKR